ncbi:MAG: hypothetical protein E7643_03220 [Ruminococcaceae bacterium]|nr:hypothetical protein [Oscillospiraceae bacterium]
MKSLNIWKVLTLVLVFCLAIACAACGTSEEGGETSIQTSETSAESEETATSSMSTDASSEPEETESTEPYETLPEGDPIKDPWVDESDLNT